MLCIIILIYNFTQLKLDDDTQMQVLVLFNLGHKNGVTLRIPASIFSEA